MKILHIDSSVTGANSVSRPLTKETVAKLIASNPGAEVTYRDLVGEPLSHYTAVLRLNGADSTPVDPAQKLELEMGEAILSEFLASDVVVVGAPMYNFSVPSQLKAWVDLICVSGKTFSYTAAGPQGLCGGKRAIIISTRGGLYGEGSNNNHADFQENYLKAVFGFLGIKDIQIVRAEGVAYGPDKAAEAIASAKQQIASLA
jgi:FMN-dependent NADH-azoreductase